MSEYRVDELARAAGTSVRNVRAYQDRGLLEPPRRVGRNGLYSESHLERLRLIRSLLDRGYTFATIGELLSARSRRMDVEDLMWMHELAATSWSPEQPLRVSLDELAGLVGDYTATDLERAGRLGLVAPDQDGWRLPSPQLIEVAGELVRLGIPLGVVLDLAERLSHQMDAVAATIFAAVAPAVAASTDPEAEPGPPSDDAVLERVTALRPHAQRAVAALLAFALSRQADAMRTRSAGAPGAATTVDLRGSGVAPSLRSPAVPGPTDREA